jgi:protein-S-isoprenylcysteine O-methyltransferase Ste14
MPSEAVLRALAAARGIAYAVLFVALWAWLAVWVRGFDSRIPFTIGENARPFGFALGVVGGFVAFACVAVFATRGRGTPAPFDAPRAFVPSGPYRFVRNPMYLGAAAVIAGAGLLWRSPGILLLAAGFLVFFHAFVLLYEEPTLRGRFGESYERYTRSVRRWMPSRLAVLGALGAVAALYLLALLLAPLAGGMLGDVF